MLTLTLSSTGNAPTRMSTVLNVCANALIAKDFRVLYSTDMHSLFIEERLNLFPPRKAFPKQLPASAYNAMKAVLGYEEDRRAELLEDQGGKDA